MSPRVKFFIPIVIIAIIQPLLVATEPISENVKCVASFPPEDPRQNPTWVNQVFSPTAPPLFIKYAHGRFISRLMEAFASINNSSQRHGTCRTDGLPLCFVKSPCLRWHEELLPNGKDFIGSFLGCDGSRFFVGMQDAGFVLPPTDRRPAELIQRVLVKTDNSHYMIFILCLADGTRVFSVLTTLDTLPATCDRDILNYLTQLGFQNPWDLTQSYTAGICSATASM